MQIVPKKAQTYEWAMGAMTTRANGVVLKDIAKRHHTQELLEAAVMHGKCSLKDIPDSCITADMCQDAVANSYRELEYVPKRFQTYGLLLDAVSRDPEAYGAARCIMAEQLKNPNRYTSADVRLAMEAIRPMERAERYISEYIRQPEFENEREKEEYIAENFGAFNIRIPRTMLLDALKLLYVATPPFETDPQYAVTVNMTTETVCVSDEGDIKTSNRSKRLGEKEQVLVSIASFLGYDPAEVLNLDMLTSEDVPAPYVEEPDFSLYDSMSVEELRKAEWDIAVAIDNERIWRKGSSNFDDQWMHGNNIATLEQRLEYVRGKIGAGK